jgi:hypothetical protein
LMFIFGVLTIAAAATGASRRVLPAVEDEDRNFGLIRTTRSGPTAAKDR